VKLDGKSAWTTDQKSFGEDPCRSRLRTVVRHRHFPLVVALLAVVVTLPSLQAGLLVDDYHHKLLFTHADSPVRLLDSPLDLFRFFDGDPERLQQLKDLGVLPWWTADNAKAAFWRPLTSLTHWLDYALWPNMPALMHAHSILWYGVLALLATLLYRRVACTVGVAAVAALLFVFDDAHGTPVGFLANRNAIIAATFGVLTLIAHDRYRRGRSRLALFGALVALAASLFSAEAGVATAAYLVSYSLFIDRGAWQHRLGSILPYLTIIIAWRLLWNKLGYGIANIGVYIDPLGEPWRYLAAVKDRAPILLLAQLLGPPADITMFLEPAGTRLLWAGALAFLACLAMVLVPLLRHDRVARFWALGTLLSILPICATFPSDRLLVFTSLGAMGLVAQFLAAAFGSARHRLGRRPWRIGAVTVASLFVLVHAVIAPPALMFRAACPMVPKPLTERMLIGPLDEAVATQDLIVVNPPLVFVTSTSMLIRADEQMPSPRCLRLLGSSLFQPVRITRPDINTLIVRPHYGYYAWVLDALFRHPKRAFHSGDRVELSGMTIDIRETTSAGRPLEVAFIFPVALEDPSLRWMQYGSGGFVPFTPPAIGQTVVLPAVNLPWHR
jgi:hypothetical protein